MRSRIIAVAVLVCGIVSMSLPAQAHRQESERVRGIVDCEGTLVHYKDARYMSGSGDIEMLLSRGSRRSSRPSSGLKFLVETASASDMQGTVSNGMAGTKRWVRFNTRNFPPMTQFTLAAQVVKNSGHCDASWAGTLYF